VRADSRGFTLVELLVVIAIMGIGAALVAVTWWRGDPSGREGALTRSALTAKARTLAVARSQHLLLEVHDDGQWVVRGAQRTTAVDTVATGRLVSDPRLPADAPDLPASFQLEIDPLGSCRPVSFSAAPSDAPGRAFDLTQCRWGIASPGSAPDGAS